VLDIDECVKGLDTCHTNAYCINTLGSYTCKCYNGYVENRSNCI